MNKKLLLITLALISAPVSSKQHYTIYDITDRQNPRLLVSKNGKEKVKPASTMKVLTTGVALKLLGPQYRWQTPIFASSNTDSIEELVFKGSGDPSIDRSSMLRLVTALRYKGLKHIKNTVWLDNNGLPSSGHRSRGGKPYTATPSGLMYDKQLVTMHIAVKNKKVSVISDPKLPFTFRIKTTKGRGSKCNPKALSFSRSPGSTEITMRGRLTRCPYQRAYAVLGSSNENFAYAFRYLWLSMGGTFGENIEFKFDTPDYQSFLKIHVHTSDSLLSIIGGTNKWSNNVMARNILLTLGKEKGYSPTELAGAMVVKNTVTKLMGAVPPLTMLDGAGLSHKNRVTTDFMAKVMVEVNKFDFGPELISSLPVGGADGTLRNRFKPVKYKVHAKTGTLTGVRALMGVTGTIKGRLLAFSFVFTGKSSKYTMDKILTKYIKDN